jgi:16S rRNA (cytosine1407-C5)-methyltransferase
LKLNSIDLSGKIFEYLKNLYGEDSAKKYHDFIYTDPSMYLRVNQLKISKEELSNLLLKNYGIKTEELPSLPHSLKVVQGKELVSKSIEHIIGLFYIQGLSSMIPPLVLDPKENEIVLDLCSAPGSKTTELGEMMNNRGTLVANEIQIDRVKMLVYNIERMNLVNAGVLHSKGEFLSKVYSDHFDKILVDAPCSGLGIIQKKGEVSNWWSLERAQRLGDLQMRLLIAAIKMAKPGGEIVYSTCTMTVEENEMIINTVLKKYPVEIMEINLPIDSHEAITSYNGLEFNPEIRKGKRILPWEADSDGFFIIKLKKVGTTSPPDSIDLKKRDTKLLTFNKMEINKHLLNVIAEFGIPAVELNKYKYIIKGNDIFFVNDSWDDKSPGLFERIGTRFGSIDKNGMTNLHTQAAQIFQQFIDKRIFTIEDSNDLKKYLEGGTIKKEFGEYGQCVVKYQDFILGTAVNTKQGIKSRFPRSKRTQEISVNF